MHMEGLKLWTAVVDLRQIDLRKAKSPERVRLSLTRPHNPFAFHVFNFASLRDCLLLKK